MSKPKHGNILHLSKDKKFPKNVGSRKSFETWSFSFEGVGKPVSCEVETCSESRGGAVIGFRALFKDRHIVYDTDVVRLRETCYKYAIDSQNWEFEYVLRVWVKNEFSNANDRNGSEEAMVGVRWEKLKKIKDLVLMGGWDNDLECGVYYSMEGMQNIERGIGDRAYAELPWTQEREDILRAFCERIRQIKSTLDEALNEANITGILDGIGLTRLLEEGTVNDIPEKT